VLAVKPARRLVMRGDRVLEAFLEELNAGRERLARGQNSALDSELGAGRCWEARTRGSASARAGGWPAHCPRYEISSS